MNGLVVWITGGGSGLGRAMALECAKRGASVAVSGRRLDRLEETVAAMGSGLAIQADVTDDDDLQRAVDQIVAHHGRLDVVIANAGYSVSGRIEDLDRATWQRQLELNVVSAAMTAKLAIPALKQTRGRIALVGSVAAFTPVPRVGAYSASKAAVLLLGRTLSAELEDDGVSCTVIQPGFVASEIAQVDNDGNFDPNRKDKRPANLMWQPEDAARVMIDAIERRKVEFTFTGHGRFAAFMGRHFPGLFQVIAKRAW